MPRTASIHLPSVPAIGVFLDGDDFFSYVNKTACFVDVITYTCQDFNNSPTVRRLIVGVSHLSKKVEIRVKPTMGYKAFAGLHTKLYLAYKANGELLDAYVGSQNLVTPILCEVIVRTNKEQALYLERYFNELWSKK